MTWAPSQRTLGLLISRHDELIIEMLWTPGLFSAHSILITESPTSGAAWSSNKAKAGSHAVCSTVVCLFKKTVSIFQDGKPSLSATIYSISSIHQTQARVSISVYLDSRDSGSEALCGVQTSQCVVAMDHFRNLDWHTLVSRMSL